MLLEAIRNFHTTNENELVLCFEKAAEFIECLELDFGDALALARLNPICAKLVNIFFQCLLFGLGIHGIPELAFLHSVVITQD